MLVKVYLVTAVAALALYTSAAFFGWELGDESRDTVPASVRTSPGGYRSYHFWHSGYHGGK